MDSNAPNDLTRDEQFYVSEVRAWSSLSPDRRRALLAVLVPVEKLAAALHREWPFDGDPIETYAENVIRRLAGPTDTGSEIAADIRQAGMGGPDFTPATWPEALCMRPTDPHTDNEPGCMGCLVASEVANYRLEKQLERLQRIGKRRP